ncbi:MAG: alpha/beta hydrolase [Actinobacteria bacterium]|nr:alpha/beta hydrolase [Actinomycetota bacterium]
MTTFALVHGAGGSGWDWHLLEAELRALGHDTVAPDLPADAPTATLGDYADVVLAALRDREDVVVVGHSFGAFTAPLVAAARPVHGLVLLAGMVPAPGERPDDWWAATGYRDAARAQAAADGGLTGHEDPRVCYHHDVPDALATEALGRERAHPSPAAGARPWPLATWPDVPTRFVLCTRDRLFPAAFLRRVVRERLGAVPEELDAGHCAALAQPRLLARLLDR